MARPLSVIVFSVLICLPLAAPPAVFAQDGEPRKLSSDELKEALARDPKPYFLDVREPKELEILGTIEGYVNIPLGKLEERLSEVPKNAAVIIACNRAVRAGQAARLFEKHGRGYVGVVALSEWKEKGYDLIYPKAPEDPAEKKKTGEEKR